MPKEDRITQRWVAWLLMFALIMNCCLLPSNSAEAAETSSNYVKKLTVTYTGGDKDVGDTINKSDFSVTGELKDGSTQDISSFTLSTSKLTKESNTISINYQNKAGKTIKKTCKVTADRLIKKIDVSYEGDPLDVGDTINTSDFVIKGIRKDKREVTLSAAACEFSTKKMSKENSTKVKISYENSLGKIISDTVVIKAEKLITTITASYSGEDKDVNDTLTTSDFTVTGTAQDKSKVEIKEFTITPKKLTGKTTKVSISYKNTKGKQLTKKLSVKANKLITKISASYTGVTKKIGDTLNESDFTVTGTTLNKNTVPVTEFTLDNYTITKLKNSVKISYVNTAKETISKKISFTANDYEQSLRVTQKSKKLEEGSSITTSDFTVYLVYASGKSKKLSYTDYTLSQSVVNADGQVLVSYTADDGRVISENVVITSDTVSNIIVTPKKTSYITNTAITKSDFTVMVVYTSGKTTRADEGSYEISETSVPESGNVQVTYTALNGEKFKKEVYLGIVSNYNADTASVTLAPGITKNVGESLKASDLYVTVADTAGNYVTVSSFTITEGSKIKDVTQKVTVKFKSPNGEYITATGYVQATDVISSFSAELTGSSTLKAGDTISKDNISKYFTVKKVYKSGTEKAIDIVNDENLTVTSISGAIVNRNGYMTVGENGKDSTLTFAYTEGTFSKTEKVKIDFTSKYITSISVKGQSTSALTYDSKVSGSLLYVVDAGTSNVGVTLAKLAEAMTITAKYNDGTSKELTYKTDYKLSGETMTIEKGGKAYTKLTLTTLPGNNIYNSKKNGEAYTYTISCKAMDVYIKTIEVESYSGSTKAGTTPSSIDNYKFKVKYSTGKEVTIAGTNDRIKNYTKLSAKKLSSAGSNYTQTFTYTTPIKGSVLKCTYKVKATK